MKKLITIMLFINNISYSQDNIKSSENFNNNIKKSTRLSAILPGLGQINNKQYWKIPIIYGGMSDIYKPDLLNLILRGRPIIHE